MLDSSFLAVSALGPKQYCAAELYYSSDGKNIQLFAWEEEHEAIVVVLIGGAVAINGNNIVTLTQIAIDACLEVQGTS